MSRTEPELWAMLQKAGAMPHGRAQQARLEDVVRHADAGGFAQLAFTGRRVLADAYSVDRKWDKAFPLFARCLSEYDQRPWQFGPEEEWSLRQWYTEIAQSMAEFPEISLDQIYAAFTDMEKRFTTGGHSLRDVHAARRWVAQLAGDWAEEERCYQAWIAAGGPDPDSVWEFEPEIERLVLRGDDASLARARELAAPVLAGQRTFDQPAAPIQCQMLLPLVRAGEDEQAALAYQRSLRAIEGHTYRFEYSGMHIEFCALTGNDVEGLIRLKQMIGSFDGLNRPNGKMEFATSAAVLMRVLMEDGRGAEEIERGFHSGKMTTVAKLHAELDGIARDLAARFDARNGSTRQGDRVRARLAARPVRDFLPLTPTSRPPRRLVPRGATPDQVLDRAEWHLWAEEPGYAYTALKALPQPVPAHLAARVTEARALIDGEEARSKDQIAAARKALDRAADEHRRAGDTRRHLMCRVWLGYWLVLDRLPVKGLRIAREAVEEIRAAGDMWALAWSEMRFARTLRCAREVFGKSDPSETYSALARAAQAAAACGDPLTVGAVASEQALALVQDEGDPAEIIRCALAARDALLPIGANRLVLHAFAMIRKTHERAGTLPEYRALVHAQLNALPPGTHPNVRGSLAYQHGEALLEEERLAEAVPVLTEALADLAADDADGAQQWFQLANACFQVERYEDAVHAAKQCAHWLYSLRETGELDSPDIADDARILLAMAHHRLGEAGPALEEYTKAIDTAHKTGYRSRLAAALAGLGELLSDLDRHDEAAPRFTEASQAYAAQGDPLLAAHNRCAAAMAWYQADETDRAMTELSAAEQSVRALPPDPRQALMWADVRRVGAAVMIGMGRGPEAVRYAHEAATALRQAGVSDAAAEMDVLHAKILISDGRPDLARQLAASLAQQGHPDAAEAVLGALAG